MAERTGFRRIVGCSRAALKLAENKQQRTATSIAATQGPDPRISSVLYSKNHGPAAHLRAGATVLSN